MRQIEKDIKKLANLNVDKYVRKVSGACEENVKIKIVIPLLELLGYNSQQDMDFEHHVRNRKADIALLFGNKPKLFVESKDLDENLDNHIHQALDYAFNKGVEWVILTNGLEIRVYKSFIPYIPSEDRLIFTTTLSNLPQSFNALFELVSKEHLQDAKKLNEKAESIRENITTKILIEDLAECRKRLATDLFIQFKTRYETDSEFKEVIDAWAIAVKMNLSDPGLIEKLCREGAYTLINRVLFLRICEDKGHIKAKLSKNAIAKWREMVEDPSKMLGMAFDEIGERFEGLYKSPLFDSINYEDIEWNTDTIYFVLDKLGVHDFSKISKDILGRAYEQHISRKERKELGQFYTPDFVIDYILDQVGVSTEKKILDPACGSGGFLMKAYDRLRKQYLEQGWAEDKIHKEILRKNLFGIDINPFATQLTAMNLLLKDLDHPTGEINVVEGDSLDKTYDGLDMDILHTEAPIARVTKVDKKASLVKLLRERPFDIVIGNPPYVRGRSLPEVEKARYSRAFKTAYKSYDLYILFIERGLELLEDGGIFSMIVSRSLLGESYATMLRKHILNTCCIKEIVDFAGIVIFDQATVTNCIMVLQRESDKGKRDSNLIKATKWADKSTHTIIQKTFNDTPLYMFRINLTEDAWSLIMKVRNQGIPLGAPCYVSYSIAAHSEIENRKKEAYIFTRRIDDKCKPFIEGKELSRYSLEYMGRFLQYDPRILRRPSLPELFENEKIVFKGVSAQKRGLVAYYDDQKYYVGYPAICATLKYHLANVERRDIKISQEEVETSKQFNLRYILALINSSLMDFYFTKLIRSTVTVYSEDIRQLPIKKASVEQQEEFATLVDKMLSLNKQLNDPAFAEQQEVIQKEIEATDMRIDEKVYELYGLTEEEEFCLNIKTSSQLRPKRPCSPWEREIPLWSGVASWRRKSAVRSYILSWRGATLPVHLKTGVWWWLSPRH